MVATAGMALPGIVFRVVMAWMWLLTMHWKAVFMLLISMETFGDQSITGLPGRIVAIPEGLGLHL